MYVCMCVHMYVCMYLCMHVFMHASRERERGRGRETFPAKCQGYRAAFTLAVQVVFLEEREREREREGLIRRHCPERKRSRPGACFITAVPRIKVCEEVGKD